jgi:hypothetical protein
MARASYIYLVFLNTGELLSAHTVKHEAHTWLKQSKWTPWQTRLARMKDGIGTEKLNKDLVKMEWEPELFR